MTRVSPAQCIKDTGCLYGGNKIPNEQPVLRLFFRAAATGFGHAQGLQDHGQWAELGKAELEEIGSHKGSEKEPVWMVKEGACFHPQG